MNKAPIYKRVIAYAIDHVLLTSLIVFGAFATTDFNAMEGVGGVLSIFGLFFKVLFLGMAFYMCKDFIKGVSFGKWLMGIAVRDQEDFEKVPSYGRLFIRNVPVLIWFVELIMLLVDSNRQRLGDKWAKCHVVETRKYVKVLPLVLSIVLGAVVFVFAIVFVTFKAIKGSPAYQLAEQEIRANESLINEIGPIQEFGWFPFGSIQTVNGEGYADFSIHVTGLDGERRVHVYLEKDGFFSDWEVEEMGW